MNSVRIALRDSVVVKKAEGIAKIIFDICTEVIRKKSIAKSTAKSFSQEKDKENAKGI